MEQPIANKWPFVQRLPGSPVVSHNDHISINEVQQPPMSRKGSFNPRNLIFPSPTSGRFKVPQGRSPAPPLPLQSTYYHPATRGDFAEEKDVPFVKAIHVRKEWDVETGDSDEMDRQGLVRGTDKW